MHWTRRTLALATGFSLVVGALVGAGAPAAVAVKAKAKPSKVTARASSPTVLVKSSFTVSGSVRPKAPGRTIRVQKLLDGRWRTVDRTRTTTDSTYRVRLRSGATPRKVVLRVRAAVTRKHAAATSKPFTVYVTDLTLGGAAFPRVYAGKRLSLTKAQNVGGRYGGPYEVYANGTYVMAYLTPSTPIGDATDVERGWGFIGDNASCTTPSGVSGYYRTRSRTSDRNVRLGGKRMRHQVFAYRCNTTTSWTASSSSPNDPGWRCGSALCPEVTQTLDLWTGNGYTLWVWDYRDPDYAAQTALRRSLISKVHLR